MTENKTCILCGNEYNDLFCPCMSSEKSGVKKTSNYSGIMMFLGIIIILGGLIAGAVVCSSTVEIPRPDSSYLTDTVTVFNAMEYIKICIISFGFGFLIIGTSLLLKKENSY